MDNSLPYIRFRFLPNNQIIISRRSRNPSVKKQGDGVREKTAESKGRYMQQIEELMVATELIDMIGFYQVELPVGVYKMDTESEGQWRARQHMFRQDSRFKPYLPYKKMSVDRHDDLYETDREMYSRISSRSIFLGVQYSEKEKNSRLRKPRWDQLVRRAGYVWDSVILKSSDVAELKLRLKCLGSQKPLPLDITRDFQEGPERPPLPDPPAPENSSKILGADYPETKFSFSARRKMHSAGYVFDRLCSIPGEAPNALFLTLTLPGGTDLAMRTLAAWSGYIQNRLMQVIRDTEREKNIELHWLKCWEFQKRGALHLHLVLGADKKVDYTVLESCASSMRDLWYAILLDFGDKDKANIEVKYGGKSGKKPFVDMFERADSAYFKQKTWRTHPDKWQDKIERVKKSVGRYLSKYTGKSKDFNGRKKTNLYYPSRWYGCSRALSQEVKRLTIDVSFTIPISDNQGFACRINDLKENIKSTIETTVDFVILTNGSIVKKGSDLYRYLHDLSPSDSLTSSLLEGSSTSFFSSIDFDLARQYVSETIKDILLFSNTGIQIRRHNGKTELS